MTDNRGEMKRLEDYLYYEEKEPDLKIYHGDMFDSWYNNLITRRSLWDRKGVIDSQKSILKSVSDLAGSITRGGVIQFRKKVAEQGLCVCSKVSAHAQYAEAKNQKDTISTEIRLTMHRLTLKSLVGNAIWRLTDALQTLSKRQKKLRVFTDAWLLWKRSISRHIVSEGINIQGWLMRRGQKYVVLA